jgi:hypothetical protein
MIQAFVCLLLVSFCLLCDEEIQGSGKETGLNEYKQMQRNREKKINNGSRKLGTGSGRTGKVRNKIFVLLYITFLLHPKGRGM